MTTLTARPYQQESIDRAVEFVSKCLKRDGLYRQAHAYASAVEPPAPVFEAPGAPPLAGADRRLLQIAFMGTGKSLIMQRIREMLLELTGCDPSDVMILVSGPETARYFMPEDARRRDFINDDLLMREAEKHGITTILRLRNRILNGRREPAAVYIVDEAHHSTMQTASDLAALSGPETIWLGFTATGYRSTARQTKALHELWGEPVPILTVTQAIEGGWASAPRFRVEPLIDDDKIIVENGEFVVAAANEAVMNRCEALADFINEFFDCCSELGEFTFDRPTMIACPGRESAKALVETLEARTIPAAYVDGDTARQDRDLAYHACRRREAILVQIAVVGEGVDLPWLARLIDARPTMSPVAWFQLCGRICRPKELAPEYICVCRNLSRHAYLFEGYVPSSVIREELTGFDGPSSRDAVRFLGFENLPKFKRFPVRTKEGIDATYVLVEQLVADPENPLRPLVREQWIVIAAPNRVEAIVGRRVSQGRNYGRWQRAELPGDFAGFGSSTWRGQPTEPMTRAWRGRALSVGLDPTAVPKQGRGFAPMFALLDMRVRI
jgi:hypothetical protein